MKRISGALLVMTAMFASAAAFAEPYVDYVPQKGYWQVTAIEVDRNHIDDYLTGLRGSQVTALDVLKKHGLIDDYKFMVRNGYSKGAPNVLILTHSATTATIEADKARDQAVEKEIYAAFSKDKGEKAVAGYEKYRTFIDDGQWTDIVMVK